MTATTEELLEQTLTADSPSQRRDGFLQLVASKDWRAVLAPHVISQQYCTTEQGHVPDDGIFSLAARLIASDEEKVQRVLELADVRYGDALLLAVARQMGSRFVEIGLAHLRTADEERAALLMRVLYEAASGWVSEPTARFAIKQRLKQPGEQRLQLISWLCDARRTADFVDEILAFPPSHLEEWSALGRAQAENRALFDRALAHLQIGPDPLAYLLRLDPVPDEVYNRIMCAAKPEWLLGALEVAVVETLYNRKLLPAVDLAVRLGGRHLATAVAWLHSARYTSELLELLAKVQRERPQPSSPVPALIWNNRRHGQANRALELGRRGTPPDADDAQSLVRQLSGSRMQEIVEEILSQPLPALFESVLRPLCGVNAEAARHVASLTKSSNGELARRAREALQWADVLWPIPEDPDVPDTFAPLGKGI